MHLIAYFLLAVLFCATLRIYVLLRRESRARDALAEHLKERDLELERRGDTLRGWLQDLDQRQHADRIAARIERAGREGILDPEAVRRLSVQHDGRERSGALRIGFDASKALNPRDGIGMTSRHLLQALMDAEGDHEIELYGFRELVTEESFLRAFPGSEKYLESGRVRLGAWSQPHHDADFDVFHSIAWNYPFLYHGPVVFTCYDLTFLTHPELHTYANQLCCTSGTLEACFAGARFVAISETTAEEMRRCLKIPDERMRVIYLAPGAAFYPREDAAERVRRLYGIGENGEQGFVLSVGTQEPRKNLRRLLEAWDLLDESLRKRFPLLLVGGQGWLHDELDRREAAGVRRLGFVPDEDLVALYSTATIFAYPSIAEGFGLPIVEAMSCGAPVITSVGGATEEVAADAACLVDAFDPESIADGLRGLLEDDEERARLRELGFERAKRFSWEIAARETLDLYRDCLS